MKDPIQKEKRKNTSKNLEQNIQQCIVKIVLNKLCKKKIQIFSNVYCA